ncbi:uncharacterized protein [Anoplolepis gracilipes]|uniref:uncharacterized protein isoform X4 n=1 Tax=Anoplolepis gracilipes TaxID=354296 RepID=UPI003B9FC934
MFSRVSVSVMKKQQRTNKRRGEGPGRHRAPTEQPYDHNALHSAVAHRIGKICHHMSNVPHESHKKRTRFYYIFFSCRRDSSHETGENRKDDNQKGTANILNLRRIFLTSRNEFILRATSVPRSSLAKYLALRA